MHRADFRELHPLVLRAGWRVVGCLAVLGMMAGLSAEPLASAQQAVPAKSPEKAAQPVVVKLDATASAALDLDHRIIADAKDHSEIMTNLGYLSDVIGPRLTGSAALKRANEWTAERMRGYGLENVHLEPWTIPMGWERGTATGKIVEPDNGRVLSLAAMGWSPSTKGKIVGDVVILSARNQKDLAALKGKLKNAIVLRGQPQNIRPIGEKMSFNAMFGGGPGGGLPPAERGNGQRGNNPAGGNAKGEKDAKGGSAPGGSGQGRQGRGFGEMMGFYRELNEFLRTEGAAVVLQDAGKPHNLLNMGGGWQGRDRTSAADPIPSVFLAHEHYAQLYRLASRPAPAKTRVEIEVTNKFVPGPVVVYNTVGEIKGTEKPDEYVVVGAHLDSWDLGQGTTDNGTGSSVVLETARLLVNCGVKPKRTIRFVLFTGEEQGLHGSRQYVDQHKTELPKVSMCLVHDTGTGKVTGIGLQGRASIKPILEAEIPALKELGVEINLRGMGGTDHASFERAGVPGFAFQQDPAEYRLTHHSQSDTLDKAHADELAQGAEVMAVTAMHVANLPGLLPREKADSTTRQE